ncbi:aquaporin-like protein, partial [Acephala macrosclerotiorum]
MTIPISDIGVCPVHGELLVSISKLNFTFLPLFCTFISFTCILKLSAGMAQTRDREIPSIRPGAGAAGRINRTGELSKFTRQQDFKLSQKPLNNRGSQRAGHSPSRPNHPTISSGLPRNSPSKLPSPRQPHYSLAGNPTPQAYAPSYVDPRYYDYNPNYRKPKDQPVWGLAKPLPRVVRPGIRRGGRETREKDGVVENRGAEIDAPGSAEAIPQLGMIDEQRQEEGKERIESQPQNEEDRSYGHRQRDQRKQRKQDRQESRRSQNTAVRVGSENSVVDRYGTPKDERSNPLEEWRSRTSSPNSDPFDDAKGDLGDRRPSRLSSVLETPMSREGMVSNASVLSGVEAEDFGDIDLEAGDKVGDWPVEQEEAEQYMREEEDMHNSWASIRARFREPLAEFLATMIAVLIGLSTNLSAQTSNATKGTYISENWAWGLGVTIGIYVAGGISGGHLNPAISLTLALYRGFPLRKAGMYISAQLLGALIAGLLAYGIYKGAILAFDSAGGTTRADDGSANPVGLYAGGTGASFYTQPASFAGAGVAFANELLATAILSCPILALGDDSNAPPGAGMHAFIVGLLVTALTMAFGFNTGACLNPARDFGPRLA